jgi:hypothetical protein
MSCHGGLSTALCHSYYFIYFLLQKSKNTAAAEYAVAVLAVDMQKEDVLFHCLFYCCCLHCSVKYIGFQVVDISVQVRCFIVIQNTSY